MFIFITIYPTQWCASALNIYNKANLLANKDHSHHVEWDISKEELLKSLDNGEVTVIHNVIDIADTMLCFTSTTTNDIYPLILHNTKAHGSDENMSFNSDTTEFGTDNCATRHICSLLNLFTDMCPAPKIGVTGVAGSLMASGNGTVQFSVTDDNGERKMVKLKNVIYIRNRKRI